MNYGSHISATAPRALEALKADAIDWRIENSAKGLGHCLDFPAVADKRVLLEEFLIHFAVYSSSHFDAGHDC